MHIWWHQIWGTTALALIFFFVIHLENILEQEIENYLLILKLSLYNNKMFIYKKNLK